MVRISSNVKNIIDKIKEIQQVYQRKIEPMIEEYEVNGFDIKNFVTKFIPVVV